MTLTINTTVDNLAEDLQGVFESLQEDWRELTYVDVINETHQELAEESRAMFGSGHDPAGNPWAPLAPSTVQRKGHAKILIDTRRLRKSLTTKTGSGDSIREVISEPGRSHGLSFGTSVPYSIFHQAGGDRLPQRIHVGTNLQFIDRLSRKVAVRTVEKLQERQL